ncbi:hypothetical protein EJB05_09019, partial [Eragrostis curvula]
MGTPKSATTSTCSVEVDQGTHLFHVANYRLHEDLAPGRSVRSAPFSVGGYDWAVRFYPNGVEKEEGSASMLLELVTKNATARASCHFRLLHRAGAAASSSGWQVSLQEYRSDSTSESATVRAFKTKLAPYIQDDCLTIECAITVVQKPKVSETKEVIGFGEPSSELSEHLELLLDEKQGADVTFDVQGEAFAAHKIILAVRSPVFKDKFFGPERGSSAQSIIIIDDMQPATFRALLHFIYTDSLLEGMDRDLGEESRQEMIRRLLVAAGQYEIQRLKLMCEDILCRSLTVGNVATTLAFANEQGLCILKDTCLEFIASSNNIKFIMASKGYEHLKRTRPSVFVEALEKLGKLRKT